LGRIARFVVAGLPHHVTQRGNRRQTVFFSDAGYESSPSERLHD
jgi:putative transposase